MKAVIKDFTTEESWNCEWDYVSIYDGPDQQSRLLGKLIFLQWPTLSGIYIMHICGKHDLHLPWETCNLLSVIFHEILHQNPKEVLIEHNGMSLRPLDSLDLYL